MHIIAGLYRHRRLATPKSEKTRPTSSRLRESLFNICQGYIKEASFLDLFAGSGAMGFEALSRGAASVLFVEKDKEALNCIRKNIESLGVEKYCQIWPGDVFQILKRLDSQKQQFNIIYADPPYHISLENEDLEPLSTKVIHWVDQSSLLLPNGTLFIEEAFEAQPSLHNLKTLSLKNSRRMGRTSLSQYEKI